MTPKKEALRRVLIRLDCFIVMQLAINNTIEITSPIPPGAEYIGTNYDPMRDCFFVCFEHESFDPIPFGEKLPVKDVKCEHIIKQED